MTTAVVSAGAAVFYAIRCRTGVIIRHSRFVWSFCPPPGSRRGSLLVNPRTRWPSPIQLMKQSSPSSEHLRPRCNSFNQFLTVAIKGKESPYTASKRSLILLCDFPSKNKNRITDRYCSFSIFPESADMPTFTCNQNKTKSPICLKLCTTW